MSVKKSLSNPSPPASRWRLWVDGCGGFLLLGGDQWSVGGMSDDDRADVCVRADWARRAGRIIRQEDDYFWIASGAETPVMINDDQTIPVAGSATMKLTKPSPLCRSAMLRLGNPHRFTDHVDGVVLVADAVLIGPGTDCHVRSNQLLDRIVITQRDGNWFGRLGLAGEFTQLPLGQRWKLSSMTMTLEAA